MREKETKKEVALKVMFIRRFIENNIADQLRNEIEVSNGWIWRLDSFSLETQSYYACIRSIH